MESLEGGVVLSAFDRSWVTEDLEVLRVFYERGARRNRVWSERMVYGGGLVPKEAVDAMILREGMERVAKGRRAWLPGRRLLS
jgi:hypothetical protein